MLRPIPMEMLIVLAAILDRNHGLTISLSAGG